MLYALGLERQTCRCWSFGTGQALVHTLIFWVIELLPPAVGLVTDLISQHGIPAHALEKQCSATGVRGVLNGLRGKSKFPGLPA